MTRGIQSSENWKMPPKELAYAESWKIVYTKLLTQSFKQKKVYSVNVSLHGSKNLHEKLTCVEGSYNLAFEAIKNLVESDVRVASNFVITTENIAGLKDNIIKLYSLGLRELTLTRFTPTGSGAFNNYLAITREQLIEALYISKDLMSEYGDLKILLANSVASCALPCDLKSFSEHCHFGISRFYIDVQGNVMMCGMSRIPIGNILEESFEQMKKKSTVYSNHVLGLDVPPVCIDCKDFKVCRGGCRAAAYAYTNDMNGADPYCLRAI